MNGERDCARYGPSVSRLVLRAGHDRLLNCLICYDAGLKVRTGSDRDVHRCLPGKQIAENQKQRTQITDQPMNNQFLSYLCSKLFSFDFDALNSGTVEVPVHTLERIARKSIGRCWNSFLSQSTKGKGIYFVIHQDCSIVRGCITRFPGGKELLQPPELACQPLFLSFGCIQQVPIVPCN